jgi:hypothetical protein
VEACPANFTAVNGAACVPVMGTDPLPKESIMSVSNAYFLTATIACIVILSIGLVVFCCLQAASDRQNNNRKGNRSLRTKGMKYEKAPMRPVDDLDIDDSDEEVETFSVRRLSDALKM